MRRRSFLKSSGLLTSGTLLGAGFFGGCASSKPKRDTSLPVRIGVIGAAGRGHTDMMSFMCMQPYGAPALKEPPKILPFQPPEISALCDVDKGPQLEKAIKDYMGDKHLDVYSDYRKMLEREHRNLDAVCISTPDVSHFAAAMTALEYGLDVYLQKPLCHNIWQIRTLQAKAREKGVITQMGNQSHSANGIQYCKEWIDAGLIGKVREVIVWTDRPYRGMFHPTAMKDPSKFGLKAKVPATLDWDLWQNVAQESDYRANIVPGVWRSWWQYGSGSLGDIGCHMLDIPVFALGLGLPYRVVSRQVNGSKIFVPGQDVVEYYFENSNQGVPVKISWHSGVMPSKQQGNIFNYDKSLLPKLPKEFTDMGKSWDNLSDNGQFLVGDEGVIYSPAMHLGGRPVLLPKEKWNDIKNNLPEHKVKFPVGHYGNFINSIKGTEKPSSDFEYGGKLTELVQLGNLSLRTNSEIKWDAKNMKCIDNIAANAIVKEAERPNWY